MGWGASVAWGWAVAVLYAVMGGCRERAGMALHGMGASVAWGYVEDVPLIGRWYGKRYLPFAMRFRPWGNGAGVGISVGTHLGVALDAVP